MRAGRGYYNNNEVLFVIVNQFLYLISKSNIFVSEYVPVFTQVCEINDCS